MGLIYQNEILYSGSGGGGGTGDVADVYVNGQSVLDANKIAQITNYVELTQAEYDALPASKESDNVLYCIKDQATADTTVAPIIYSEDERDVGVWTDGRPLYQKTYHDSYTNPGTGSHSTNHDLPGIITQVIPGYIRYEYQGGVYYLIGTQMNSYLQITIPDTPSPTYFIATQTVGGVTQTDIYYTVQYIKETDTPGSGTWAPSGVKTVHYSENEQVVGTWIDGSPIYEKTFVTPSFTGAYSIDIGTNIGMGIIVDGYYSLNDTNTSMINYVEWFGAGNFSWTHIEKNTHLIRCNLTGYTGVGYITVRYTKATS